MADAALTGPQDRRPHPNLFKYYVLESLLLGPLFWIILIPRFLRFRTLRYHWDDDGITASWGALFRREISLDFERIQDIHLSSNLVERWLGLAKVQVQTASASSKAEMTIEGLQDYSAVRDFLYRRMRGVRREDLGQAGGAGRGGGGGGGGGEIRPDREPGALGDQGSLGDGAASAEVVQALREAAAELRALREELAARRAGPAGPPLGSRTSDSGVDPR